MIKIRKLQAKDRLILYNLLQQNEQLSQKEIELELSHIDEALFNSANSKVWVIIADSEQQPIAGYASYGIHPLLEDAFVIFNIILSPLAKDQGIDVTLLDYIEKDIHKKQGHLIVTEIPATIDFETARNLFTEHNYSRRKLTHTNRKQKDDSSLFVKEI